MRILLTTYGSRGDTEPLAGLGAALKAAGAEAVLCAPPEPEFMELAGRAGIAFAPAFMSVREWIAQAQRAPATLQVYATRMMPPQVEAIRAAAAGCDAIVATGLMPSVAAAK